MSLMKDGVKSLLTRPEGALEEERFEALVERPGVRIERIVSYGHASPEGFYYDQEEHEWIALLSGEARLGFDDGEALHLRAGDAYEIAAGRRHRVEWTKPGEMTIWLAVFYPAEG